MTHDSKPVTRMIGENAIFEPEVGTHQHRYKAWRDKMPPEHMWSDWEQDNFTLRWVGLGSARRGVEVAYELWDDEFQASSDFTPVFFGNDVSVPDHALDDDIPAHVLGWFSLRPGDTDREYFDGYSELQADWMEQRAEELAFIVDELKDQEG